MITAKIDPLVSALDKTGESIQVYPVKNMLLC
jgi:hypothetical protein